MMLALLVTAKARAKFLILRLDNLILLNLWQGYQPLINYNYLTLKGHIALTLESEHEPR